MSFISIKNAANEIVDPEAHTFNLNFRSAAHGTPDKLISLFDWAADDFYSFSGKSVTGRIFFFHFFPIFAPLAT